MSEEETVGREERGASRPDLPSEQKIYVYKKAVTWTNALDYISRPKLSDGPTGGRKWIMVIRDATPRPGPELEALCDEISDRMGRRMAQDIIRQEKEEAHRRQKKKDQLDVWDTQQSRAPSRGARQRSVAGTTSQEWYDKVKTAVDHQPLPWPYATQGCKARYDRRGAHPLIHILSRHREYTRVSGGTPLRHF